MENKEYKIVIAGDLLPSGKNIPLFEKGDAKQLFGEEICNLFAAADYSILNLEGPLTDSNKGQAKAGPVIKAPASTVNGIKALGIKAVSLANNHVTDYGNEGYCETIKVLEENNIEHIGSGINKDAVNHCKSIQIGEKKICIYCVSETFFNEPTANKAGAHIYDEYLVCNEIKELKRSHDYIIVLYHGGASYFPYPTPLVRKRMHRMADSGADVISAQHTHCIGCEEYYNNSYLLYGQGNFLFARQKSFPQLTKDGLILELTISNDAIAIDKHHIVINKEECLSLDENYTFEEFNKRGENLANSHKIIEEYQSLKFKELNRKYLEAYKGNHLFLKIYRKLFPKKYSSFLIKAYTQEQLYRCWTVANGDRMQEDIKAMWEYIINKR